MPYRTQLEKEAWPCIAPKDVIGYCFCRFSVMSRVRREEEAERKSAEAYRLAREAKIREKEKIQRVRARCIYSTAAVD